MATRTRGRSNDARRTVLPQRSRTVAMSDGGGTTESSAECVRGTSQGAGDSLRSSSRPAAAVWKL